MSRQLSMAALLAAPLFSGCGTEAPPLPEDVYEQGWDETTRSQRVRLLRRDLEDQLQRLDTLQPGTERHRLAVREAAKTLSALRPELTTTERDKREYLDLEARVEARTEDAR